MLVIKVYFTRMKYDARVVSGVPGPYLGDAR